MEQAITLRVNGRSRIVTAAPETPLIYVLRNDLGLKGTKLGCGQEQCGACKVVIDGEAVPSCRLPVEAAEGCEVTTVEGIGSPEHLHPVQRAFIDERAAQCGFCTAGLVVAAKVLLDRDPDPTEQEIRSELAVHICRCGVHPRVIRAIQGAAKEMSI